MAAKTSTQSLVEGFDKLPDVALIPDKVPAALLGVSVAHYWTMVRDGLAPAPVKVSPRCTRWRVGDLRKMPAFGGAQR